MRQRTSTGRLPRATGRILVLPLAMALSLVLATDALALSWTGNRPLTGAGTGWASRGALAASSTTVVHAAFEQVVLGSWGVYYRRSANSGTSWGTAIRLSRSSIGEAGAATLDAYGNAVDAAWLESDDILAGMDTVLVYRRSADAGQTWTDPTVLSPANESAGYPRVARRGSLVVVTWTNQLNGRIYARASTNGGATFGARYLLATTTRKVSGLYEGFPTVALGSGVSYVAFYSASKTLRMRRSTNSGASWGSAATLATNGSGYTPALAAYGSAAIVGYAAVTSSDSWAVIRRTTDKGAHWGSPVSLSSSSSTPSFSPVLSVRGSRWMAAYERCTTNSCTYSDVYYRASTNLGASWSTATKASVRTRKWEEPGDVELATKTLVLYTDYSSSTSDVYVRQGS